MRSAAMLLPKFTACTTSFFCKTVGVPALGPAACELRLAAKKAASSSASHAACRSRHKRKPPARHPAQSHSQGGRTPGPVAMMQPLHRVAGKMVAVSVSLSHGPSRARRIQPTPVGHRQRRATRRGKVRRPPGGGTGGGGTGATGARPPVATAALSARHWY